MSSFADNMAFYSAYHQESRNVWTHVTFVPVITYSFFLMLTYVPITTVAGLPITGATVFAGIMLFYYFTLDTFFAIICGALFFVLLWLAEMTTELGLIDCLLIFAVCQIVGWGAQIYAHYGFEGSKPAFLENIQQALLSAPIFVVADVMFHFGFRPEKRRAVRALLIEQNRLREDSVLNDKD